MNQRPAKLRARDLVLDVICVGPTYRIEGKDGYRRGRIIFQTDNDLDLARAGDSRGFDLVVADQIYRIRIELGKATSRRECPWEESEPSARML